jgi:hypothetical protein
MHPARLHPAHTLNNHRTRVPASSESRSAADRLKMAEAVCNIQPSNTVSDEPAASVFQHYVELGIVNWSVSQAPAVFDRAAEGPHADRASR